MGSLAKQANTVSPEIVKTAKPNWSADQTMENFTLEKQQNLAQKPLQDWTFENVREFSNTAAISEKYNSAIKQVWSNVKFDDNGNSIYSDKMSEFNMKVFSGENSENDVR